MYPSTINNHVRGQCRNWRVKPLSNRFIFQEIKSNILQEYLYTHYIHLRTENTIPYQYSVARVVDTYVP